MISTEHKSREALTRWLRGTGAVSLVISISAAGAELHATITDPLKLANAVEQFGDLMGDGPFLVSTEPKGDDQPRQDLEYSYYAAAYVIRVPMPRDVVLDTLPLLLESIAGYEYITTFSAPDLNGCLTGFVLVEIPNDLKEAIRLGEILKKTSVQYIWPDGTREIHLGNWFQGDAITDPRCRYSR